MSRDIYRGGQGYGAMNPMAYKMSTIEAQKQTNKWMGRKTQICMKCQKDSVPEKGCKMKLMPGLKMYICKCCVDAKLKEANT